MWIISLLLGTEMSAELDWKLRVSIINGMARGLVYLHEDSRLRIIHRDMIRASKILLIIRWIQEFLISEWQEFLEEIRSKPIQMESLVHSMSTLLSFFLVGFRGSYYWACLDFSSLLFSIKYLNGVGKYCFPTHISLWISNSLWFFPIYFFLIFSFFFRFFFQNYFFFSIFLIFFSFFFQNYFCWFYFLNIDQVKIFAL